MMGKYTLVEDNVNSVFAADAWKSEGVRTLPKDFTGAVSGNEYIRISTITDGQQLANPLKSVSGQVLIDIFIPAGRGPTRANLIADKLDTHLVGQTIGTEAGNVQFGSSSMAPRGNDRDNASLSKYLYSVPFNFYGI